MLIYKTVEEIPGLYNMITSKIDLVSGWKRSATILWFKPTFKIIQLGNTKSVW
jgi:hypothetical protein